MMNSEDVKRLQARELHESTGTDKPEIEWEDEGYQITAEAFPFYAYITVEHKTLTIQQDESGEYITFNSVDEIATFITLLQRAQQIIQGGV